MAEGQLHITPYRKRTLHNTILKADSFQPSELNISPFSLIDSIPHGQFQHLRCICDGKAGFLEQGYVRQSLLGHSGKAMVNRSQTDQRKGKLAGREERMAQMRADGWKVKVGK